MFLEHQEGDIKRIVVRSENHATFFNFQRCLQDTSTELENIRLTLSSCNPFPSWPSVAKGNSVIVSLNTYGV